jgi:hypothetical protein
VWRTATDYAHAVACTRQAYHAVATDVARLRLLPAYAGRRHCRAFYRQASPHAAAGIAAKQMT